MKVSIREGVFETNSSSVHSCSICSAKTFKNFYENLVWYCEKYEGKPEAYLPEEQAIEYNINYFKSILKEEYNLFDDEIDVFVKDYRENKSFYSAFASIDKENYVYDIDYYDIYVNHDDYFNHYEYEDWRHSFNDLNGTPMIAWGYCGYDG